MSSTAERAAVPARTKGGRSRRTDVVRRGVIGSLIVFAAAEAFTRAGLVTEKYLPPASSILGETVRLFGRADFRSSLWFTLQACLIGMAIATVVAVPIGMLLGLSKTAYSGAITIIEFLRPVPSVALIPLAILLYGRGTEMKVAIIVYACTWPILFNSVYGMRSVDPVAVDTARTLGFGRTKTSLFVHLPSASPFIFTGFKIASSIAVILAVSAELIAGGSKGLGIWMLEASAVGNQQRVYAVTIVAGLIGLALYLVLGVVERRLFAWAQEGGDQ